MPQKIKAFLNNLVALCDNKLNNKTIFCAYIYANPVIWVVRYQGQGVEGPRTIA